LHSDYYVHGNLNINRFIFLVLIFVIALIFLIFRPSIIGILFG